MMEKGKGCSLETLILSSASKSPAQNPQDEQNGQEALNRLQQGGMASSRRTQKGNPQSGQGKQV